MGLLQMFPWQIKRIFVIGRTLRKAILSPSIAQVTCKVEGDLQMCLSGDLPLEFQL